MADEAGTGKREKEDEGGDEGAGEPEAKRAKAAGGAVGVPAATLEAVSRAEVSAAAATADVLANRPATKAKLEWLYTTGKLTREEVTPGTLQELSEFSDSKGVEIVEQYAEADLSDVRNKGGFLGGVIKRFRDQQAPAPTSGCAHAMRQRAALRSACCAHAVAGYRYL